MALGGMGTFTDYLVHEWLEEVRENCWVSLHFDSPAVAGAYQSEFTVSTGGYKRQKVTFSSPSNRAMWNENSLRWEGLSANVIIYIGGWNRSKNGDLLWWDKLSSPRRVLEGRGYSIDPEKLVLSFA